MDERPKRHCPVCSAIMRHDSLCCVGCWKRLPEDLRWRVLTVKDFAGYQKLAAEALRSLGADPEDYRMPQKLPVDEIRTGWEGRYPDAQRIIGKEGIRKLQGWKS